MIAPFEELDRGQRPIETTDLDHTGIVFRHGTLAYVVMVVVFAVRGVERVCAVELKREVVRGFAYREAD